MNTPSTTVIPEPLFTQTTDNEPETVANTASNPPLPPNDIISPKTLIQNSPRSLPVAYTEEKIIPTAGQNENPDMNIITQMPEVVASTFTETVKTLEPDVVLIKTISEDEPDTENELLTSYQKQQKKKTLLKILSWGVKRYNYITDDDVAVVKVENLTTNETVYYLCRGKCD
jgi:hypothetical protein